MPEARGPQARGTRAFISDKLQMYMLPVLRNISINLYLHHNAKYFDVECNNHIVLTLRSNMMFCAMLHMY